MKRRSFVKGSILTGSLGSLVQTAAEATQNAKPEVSKQEFYELRVYTLNNNTQQKLMEDYFSRAAIPALNRLGCKNIGVFTELHPAAGPKIFVIIPYRSLEEFLSVNEKLLLDPIYMAAAADYLNAPATAPAYQRIESSLLQAFTRMPELEVPGKKPRLFELRRYESPSEDAGKKKIDMFNTLGEMDIFKRVGLTPVFFGETLIGGLRPNLTYMLTYDDMAEHDKNWKLFINDPEWKKISTMPEYTDAKIISRITSIFLVPADFSQI